jgi:membrane protein
MATSRPTQRQRHRSIWKLGGLTLWQLSEQVVREGASTDLPGAASELAFNFLLALFPLILFMLALFSLFATHRSQLQYSLMSYFRDMLPPAAFEMLNKITNQMAANSHSRKFTFGIVVALWFASGGISSMISTLNVVYQVHETRSWWRVRAVALVSTLAISVLVLSALFLVLVGGNVVDWIGKTLQLQSMVVLFWKGVQWPAALVFVMLSCSLIYYYAPDLESPHWYWITPGSAFGAVLWLLASIGFRVYLHFFNTYNTYYGPLGAMMMLLVWLYATGLAFLIGGEINAQIERASLPAEPGQHKTDPQVD